MVKRRDSSIELLRILLMSMIVLTHLYVHGIYCVLDSNAEQIAKETTNVGWIVISLIDYHVVCFFFISGYYGIKTKLNSLVGYLVKLLFYGLVTYLIWGILQYGFELRRFLGPKNLLSNLSPFQFFGDQWWFASSYFYLMLIAPFINKGVAFIPKYVFAGLLGLFVVFMYFGHNTPFGPLTAIMVYLTGAFLKKWHIRVVEDRALWVYISALLVLLVNTIIHVYLLDDLNIRLSTDYNSPIVLVAGVSFFFVFKNLKIKYRAWINRISSGTFGVYLLTDGFLRASFNTSIVNMFGTNVFVLVIIAVAITVLLSLVNGVLENTILKPISKLLTDSIRKLAIRIIKS